MVVVISDEYLDSEACDFQTKFALSLGPGEVHSFYVDALHWYLQYLTLFLMLLQEPRRNVSFQWFINQWRSHSPESCATSPCVTTPDSPHRPGSGIVWQNLCRSLNQPTKRPFSCPITWQDIITCDVLVLLASSVCDGLCGISCVLPFLSICSIDFCTLIIAKVSCLRLYSTQHCFCFIATYVCMPPPMIVVCTYTL